MGRGLGVERGRKIRDRERGGNREKER